MLNLQDVKKAVDHFSPEELRELRAYLDEREATVSKLRIGTMDVDAFLTAAQAIRDGLTTDEWDEIKQAINEEYIESVDADGFPLL